MFTQRRLTLPNGQIDELAVRRHAKRLHEQGDGTGRIERLGSLEILHPSEISYDEALTRARNAALCEREAIADEERRAEYETRRKAAVRAAAKARAERCSLAELKFDRDRIAWGSLPSFKRHELVEEIEAAIRIKEETADDHAVA